MKNFLKRAAVACAVSVLVACGGGGGGTAASIPVAADVAPITLTASNGTVVAQAISGQNIAFPNGIPELGLVGATTLTFSNNGSNFTLTDSAGRTATGTVTFGSIIFDVTSSSIPGLTTGKKPPLAITFDLNTSNQPANGSTVTVTAIITIGSGTSATITTTVTISSTGAVQISGTTVATTSVSTTTGATGGS